jgi:maltodextrin utilization protein YvdJ
LKSKNEFLEFKANELEIEKEKEKEKEDSYLKSQISSDLKNENNELKFKI